MAEHRPCKAAMPVQFRPEALLPRTCDTCCTTIASRDPRRRFCSRSCAASANNRGVVRNFRTGLRAPKPCAQCSRTTSNPRYCSRECSAAATRALTIARIEATGMISSPASGRAYLAHRDGWQCAICGRRTWQGRPVPLVMDHINGDPQDDRTGNLRLVCGNCDMQLPTYKARNLGRGRAWRRLRYAQGKSY